MSVYFDFRDWWVGLYIGPNHYYICQIPTLVIRVSRCFRVGGNDS